MMKPAITEIILPRTQSLEENLAYAAECGYEGFEVGLRDNVVFADAAARSQEIKRMQKLAADNGLEYTSATQRLSSVTTNMITNDDEVRAKSVETFRKLLESAAELGVDTVLLHPGQLTEDVRYDVGYQHVRDCCMQIAETAEKVKVNLGLEIVWNKLFYSVLEMRDLIDSIGSDYVGVYFDTGNVVQFAYPEHWISILGKRIKKVHVKDFRRKGNEWVQLMDGDVNWNNVMKALREDLHYDDYLIQEVGGGDMGRECVDRIKKIIAL